MGTMEDLDDDSAVGSNGATHAPASPVRHADSVDWGREAIAGATIFAVLVPSALAYSSIVGVAPVVGLIGVPLVLVAYALAGGSRVVVAGADAAVSVMVGSTVANVSPSDEQYLTAVLTLSLMVGGIFLLFRLLRLGWIADVIPQPVLKGFVQGLVWTTIVGQIAALLGLEESRTSGNMFIRLWYILSDLNTMQTATAVTGVVALAALLAFRRWLPKIPGALIVLIAAGVAYVVFDLEARGVSNVGAPTGSLINTTFAFPDRLADWSGMWTGALAIVVLAFTEHLGCTQMVSDATGERTDPNRELFGLGVANLAAGLGSSYAVTGTLSKTSVALQSGARTKVANLVTAAIALVAALTLRPMFAYLANAVLAAVVVWAMIGMIDVAYFKWLHNAGRLEFLVALAAFFGVMVLGVMPSVIVATALAIVVLGYHISRPPLTPMGRLPTGPFGELDEFDEAEPCPGFSIVRIGGPLVFLNARYVATELRYQIDQLEASELDAVLIVDCAEVSVIDTTGQRAMGSVVTAARNSGIDIRFSDIDATVWAKARRTMSAEDAASFRRYITVADAVEGRAV